MIRLARIGKKKQPYYRLVVSEKGRDLYGKSLEILGSYNPRTKKFVVKNDQTNYWLGKGAKTSATAHNLLIANNIITGKKMSVTHIKQSKKTQSAATKTAEKVEEKPSVQEKINSNSDGKNT